MFKLVETCLLTGCKGDDGELSVVAEEIVEEPGLVIDCCIGEGKVLVPRQQKIERSVGIQIRLSSISMTTRYRYIKITTARLYG